MGETTKISWTDSTINWWSGCTKVSAACDFCYAEAIASRFKTAEWGHGKPRVQVKGAAATAFKLERKAVKQGRRIKVFSNSMSDFFDSEVPDEWRDQAMAVIALTPHLDWQILTKRPKVAREYLASTAQARADGRGAAVLALGYDGPLECLSMTANLWLGTTAENQDMYDLRVPLLRETPAARHFVSLEPLLGPIDAHLDEAGLDWVIVGGESGSKARNCDLDAARSLRDQCRAAGTPFFMKQIGRRPFAGKDYWCPRDRAGADPTEWPADLRVQEFPA